MLTTRWQHPLCSQYIHSIPHLSIVCSPSFCSAPLHSAPHSLRSGKITLNGATAIPAASFDKATESRALASLVTTSTQNRLVRITMGSLHLLGAVLYNMRTANQGQGQGKDAAGSPLVAAKEWGLTVAMCVVAGIWISSGFYGQ